MRVCVPARVRACTCVCVTLYDIVSDDFPSSLDSRASQEVIRTISTAPFVLFTDAMTAMNMLN